MTKWENYCDCCLCSLTTYANIPMKYPPGWAKTANNSNITLFDIKCDISLFIYDMKIVICLQLGSPDNKDLDERATWLDTRGLEEDFKELVYSALQEVSCLISLFSMVVSPWGSEKLVGSLKARRHNLNLNLNLVLSSS